MDLNARSSARRHLNWEEEHLFPAFEALTGMTQGPTEVMRREHEQMRALLGQMEGAIRDDDVAEALEQGDSLLMLTQQHNQKEEAILFPMAQRALGADWARLAEALRAAL